MFGKMIRVPICLAFLVMLLLVPSAQAGTFPGYNGLLAVVADSLAPGDSEIHTMNPDGTGLTPLTSTAGTNGCPSWSADGLRIAFCSTRDAGDSEIYVMNADGSDQTRLTMSPGSDSGPSWSFDRTKIAFASNRVTTDNPTGDTEIFVMDADGANQMQLTFNTVEEGNIAYSPDGSKIAFDRGVGGPSEIWVMDADGTDEMQLTSNGGTQDVDPNWSPDGARIQWRRDFGGCAQADLWVMNSDGTSQGHLVCASPGFENGGVFSPDGVLMAFSSTRDFNGGFGQNEIYTAFSDGTNQTRITTTTYNEVGLDWQPIACGTPSLQPQHLNTINYEAAVLGDTPAAYWRLGESSGTTALEQVGAPGSANDGTYAGAFTLGAPGAIAGDPDTSVDLVANRNARVETPYAPFVNGTVRTYEGWACRSEAELFDFLFGGSVRGRVAGLYTSSADPDRVYFDPRLEGGTTAVNWDGALPPDGEWFHWVLVFDEPANTAKLYINAALVGTRTVTEPYPTYQPGSFWIGNYPTQQAWHGVLDEVAVYERALSLEEIAEHHSRGSGSAPE